MATVASRASVVAALRLLGRRNAGTPLEIASTPVSAAQPEEKARATRNTSAMVVRVPSYPSASTIWKAELSAAGSVPVAWRKNPKPIIPTSATMKAYAGNANHDPDSRTPRRFTRVSATTSTEATSASWPLTNSSAEAAYCAAEDSDTATTST